MATPSEQIRAYQKATQLVRDRLRLVARTAWWSLPAYRDADIDSLVNLIVPQVMAGQRTIAQLTDTYLSGLALNVAQGIDEAAVTGAVRGVPMDEVYRRPGKTVWNDLSKGKAPNAAISAGLTRLLSLVATDLQLTQRLQERASLISGGFDYYRRTLTGRENCGLCVIASTQRYHSASLKPIHPGCDCGVAQIAAGSDPGQVLNEDVLEGMHELVDLQFGDNDRGARIFMDKRGREVDYKDILVREHGEYGPTLTWRKDKFTGPGELAA